MADGRKAHEDEYTNTHTHTHTHTHTPACRRATCGKFRTGNSLVADFA